MVGNKVAQKGPKIHSASYQKMTHVSLYRNKSKNIFPYINAVVPMLFF